MQQNQQNYQGDELSLYLENALSPLDNIRKPAEDKINYICNQNFGQFLTSNECNNNKKHVKQR